MGRFDVPAQEPETGKLLSKPGTYDFVVVAALNSEYDPKFQEKVKAQRELGEKLPAPFILLLAEVADTMFNRSMNESEIGKKHYVRLYFSDNTIPVFKGVCQKYFNILLGGDNISAEPFLGRYFRANVVEEKNSKGKIVYSTGLYDFVDTPQELMEKNKPVNMMNYTRDLASEEWLKKRQQRENDGNSGTAQSNDAVNSFMNEPEPPVDADDDDIPF